MRSNAKKGVNALKSLKLCAWVVASLFVFTLAACGGASGSSSSGTGTLSLMLTDMPREEYCEVNVKIKEVHIHKASNNDSEEGSWIVHTIGDTGETEKTYNLKKLVDGVLE